MKERATRRGVADTLVITIALMLVLVAVGVVWAFKSSSIANADEEASAAWVCLRVSVEILDAHLDGIPPPRLTITVRRGSDDAELTKLRVLVDDQALSGGKGGEQDVSEGSAAPLRALGSATFRNIDPPAGTVAGRSVVKVVPVVRTEEGMEVVCRNAVAEKIIA